MNRNLDTYSFRCGVIDAFSEVVHAGVKRIAYSHATTDYQLFLDDISYAKIACQKYDIKMYIEEDMLTTDLFKQSDSKDHYVVILYLHDKDLKEYLDLKEKKRVCLEQGTYDMHRHEIAQTLGHLLSYSDERIEAFIANNPDKEM